MPKMTLVKELCEFLGTTILCFLVISIPHFADVSLSASERSLFAGAIVILIIYAIGTISGAHINPIVSFGFWFSGSFPTSQLFRYIAAQVFGAISALILLTVGVGKQVDWLAATPKIASPVAFLVETFLTGFLIFVIFGVATNDCRICPDSRPIAGIVIGITVAALAFFGGTLGVGILNPAVLLVLTILSGSWLNFGLYLVAATIGTVIAVRLYQTTRNI